MFWYLWIGDRFKILFWSAPTQGKYSQSILKISMCDPVGHFFKTFQNLSKNVPRPLPDTSQDIPKITKKWPRPDQKGSPKCHPTCQNMCKNPGIKGSPDMPRVEISWDSMVGFLEICLVWRVLDLRGWGSQNFWGSFCHHKLHFFIKVGQRCRRSLAGAVFVIKNCTSL